MKRILILFGLLFATAALAADNPLSCSGTNCKISTAAPVRGVIATGEFNATGAAQGSLGANMYINSAGSARALTTSTGASYFSVLPPASGAGQAFRWLSSSSAQTADAALSSSATVGQISGAGAWTLGASGGSETHTVNGNVSTVGSISTDGSSITSNGGTMVSANGIFSLANTASAVVVTMGTATQHLVMCMDANSGTDTAVMGMCTNDTSAGSDSCFTVFTAGSLTLTAAANNEVSVVNNSGATKSVRCSWFRLR